MNYRQIKTGAVLGLVVMMCACGGGGSSSSDSAVGTGAKSGQTGSMARFAIVGDYLYTIAGSKMQLFNVATPADPVPYAEVYVGRDIETIFGYQDALFIGSISGVYIYDNTNPANPQYVSDFSHARACDPVVVSGNYAYITLRDGQRCSRANNQLDIINVADIRMPFLVDSFAMQNPKGLGVDQNRLFVCDGIAGLKTFSLDNPVSPQILSIESDMDCYDLIASSGLLVVSDSSGIVQYGYNQTGSALTPRGKILAQSQ